MRTLTQEEIEDGWIKWDGGECPVPFETYNFLIEYRDGFVTMYKKYAGTINWLHTGSLNDIVAYKLFKEGETIEVPDGMDAVEFANQLNNKEYVNHPDHYGGDTTYEAIKVIEAWDLGFCLGNTIKYISRAGKKGDALEDLKKARWYLDREISKLEKE